MSRLFLRLVFLLALLAVLSLPACQFPAGISQLLGQESPTTAPSPSAYPEPEQLMPYPGGEITPYPGDEATPYPEDEITPYPGNKITPEPDQVGETPYPQAVSATPETDPTGATPYPEVSGASSSSSTPSITAPATASLTPTPTTTPFTNLFPLAQGAYPGPTGETPYPELQTTTPVDAYPGPGVTSQASPTLTPGLGATPGATQPGATLPAGAPPITPSPSLPLTTATSSLFPTQTPFLTPTPTLTSTPTRTLTPLPPPPWVSAQLRATDPRTVRLASGKVQLVEFFAFWSGPSQAMAPIVQALETEYRYRMNFAHLDIDDPGTRIFQSQLGFRTEPHYFLLDPQGRVLRQWVGYVTPAEFRQAFNAALSP